VSFGLAIHISSSPNKSLSLNFFLVDKNRTHLHFRPTTMQSADAIELRQQGNSLYKQGRLLEG